MNPPGKWHLARVGVLTGLFGLGAGWMLFSTPPSPSVRVAGASVVTVRCTGFMARTEGELVPRGGRPPCAVEAVFPDGVSADGEVRVNLPGILACGREGEVLRCESS